MSIHKPICQEFDCVEDEHIETQVSQEGKTSYKFLKTGTYLFEYTVTDFAGNESILVKRLNVKDSTTWIWISWIKWKENKVLIGNIYENIPKYASIILNAPIAFDYGDNSYTNVLYRGIYLTESGSGSPISNEKYNIKVYRYIKLEKYRWKAGRCYLLLIYQW